VSLLARPAGFLACAAVLALSCPDAGAQTTAPSRVAVSLGPQWVGTADAGARDAVLTANGAAAPLTLFRTESALSGGIGLAGSLSARATRSLWLELGVAYHPATLTTTVFADAEGGDLVEAEAGVQQYRIEGGVLWMLPVHQAGRRLRFFVAGAGGYVRQLYGNGLLAETGRSLSGGGGLLVWLPRRAGPSKAAGLRLDGRLLAMGGGASPGDRAAVAPVASAQFFLGF